MLFGLYIKPKLDEPEIKKKTT